jgi:hypothetical protein
MSVKSINSALSSVYHSKMCPSVWEIDESAFFSSEKQIKKNPAKSQDGMEYRESEMESSCDEDDDKSRVTLRTFVPLDSIKNFDGEENNPDKAHQWLDRFKHVARSAGWTEKEKIKNFSMYMANYAKQWHIQLPVIYTKQWSVLEKKFRKTFCVDETSSTQKYYDAYRKGNESPKQYLWRLNALAKKANISIRPGLSGGQHVRQFLKTVDDEELCSQIQPLRLKDVDELLEIIEEINLLNAESRSRKEQRRKKGTVNDRPFTRQVRFMEAEESDDSDMEDLGALGRALAIDGKASAPDGSQNNSRIKKCDTCNRRGHTKETCWSMITCRYCKKMGHPKERCNLYCTACKKLHMDEVCPREKFMEMITKACRDGLQLPKKLMDHLNLTARQ